MENKLYNWQLMIKLIYNSLHGLYRKVAIGQIFTHVNHTAKWLAADKLHTLIRKGGGLFNIVNLTLPVGVTEFVEKGDGPHHTTAWPEYYR